MITHSVQDRGAVAAVLKLRRVHGSALQVIQNWRTYLLLLLRTGEAI